MEPAEPDGTALQPQLWLSHEFETICGPELCLRRLQQAECFPWQHESGGPADANAAMADGLSISTISDTTSANLPMLPLSVRTVFASCTALFSR